MRFSCDASIGIYCALTLCSYLYFDIWPCMYSSSTDRITYQIHRIFCTFLGLFSFVFIRNLFDWILYVMYEHLPTFEEIKTNVITSYSFDIFIKIFSKNLIVIISNSSYFDLPKRHTGSARDFINHLMSYWWMHSILSRQSYHANKIRLNIYI